MQQQPLPMHFPAAPRLHSAASPPPSTPEIVTQQQTTATPASAAVSVHWNTPSPSAATDPKVATTRAAGPFPCIKSLSFSAVVHPASPSHVAKGVVDSNRIAGPFNSFAGRAPTPSISPSTAASYPCTPPTMKRHSTTGACCSTTFATTTATECSLNSTGGSRHATPPITPRWPADPPLKQSASPDGGRSSATTKNRLADLREGFAALERQLQDEVLVHRKSAESFAKSLTDGILHVESSLAAEVEERATSTHKLNEAFTVQLAVVERKLQKQFNKKLDRLDAAVSSLTQHVARLEEDVRESKEVPLQRLATLDENARKGIADLKARFDFESHEECRNLAAIQSRLECLKQQLEDSTAHEQHARESSVALLHNKLNESQGLLTSEAEKFKSLVLQELQTVRGQIELEKSRRDEADGEIVQTLNCYARSLQGVIKVTASP